MGNEDDPDAKDRRGLRVKPIIVLVIVVIMMCVMVTKPFDMEIGPQSLGMRGIQRGQKARSSLRSTVPKAEGPQVAAVCKPVCGSHGECVGRRQFKGVTPNPVCVCRDGFWGRNCTKPYEEWARIARFDAHKKNAPKGQGLWWYLNSTAYRLRYHLAAQMFKNFNSKHILEIGGFVTPIDMFVHPYAPVETVTVVDPVIQTYSGEDEQGRQILRLPTTLDEYTLRGDEDAVLFLGIPQEFKSDTIPMPASVKTVIIGGAKYSPIQRVMQKIADRAQRLGFSIELDLTMDFSDMVGPAHPEISRDPDNHHRRIVVLNRA